MKAFFNTNNCFGEKLVEIGNLKFYIKKIHNAKSAEQEESFEYYLLDSNRKQIASYKAKLEEADEKCTLHLYDGSIIDGDTKENMKKLSILLSESFSDLDAITYHGRIIVDAKLDKYRYSKFQHVCMRFDDDCLNKMKAHICYNNMVQEPINVQRERVSKWLHLYEHLQSLESAESQK